MPVETYVPDDASTTATSDAHGGATATSDADRAETATSDADDTQAPVYRCPYCDRPFTTRERVDLHVGLEHYDVCTDDEADAFEDAYLAENESLRVYRLKAAAAIIVLYFGLLMVYAVAT